MKTTEVAADILNDNMIPLKWTEEISKAALGELSYVRETEKKTRLFC